MRFVKVILRILVCFLIAKHYSKEYLDVPIFSIFTVVYGISLVLVLMWSFRNRMPYIELVLASMGIQILIAPFLEYHYFHNEIFGVMRVNEGEYFSFTTWAIIALEFGVLIFNKKKPENHIFNVMRMNGIQYEKLGITLIWAGYFFYLIHLLNVGIGFAFVIKSMTYLRFIGMFYLIFTSSKKAWMYALIVFIPFIVETMRVAVFIELLIIGLSTVSIIFLKKRVSPILTTVVVVISIFSAIILQSVKHEYRELTWKGEETSLTGLMLNQQSTMTSKKFRGITSIFNIRINQGWIVTDVMVNSQAKKFDYDGSFISKEIIGVIVPRFLYPNKLKAGTNEKFDYFVGWDLDAGTAMNIGLIGDAYGNFGPRKGIAFTFLFGLFIGYGHSRYQKGLIKYPDLICWTPLFYNYLIRAGNDFYMITNWYIKTGFLTLLFFLFIRHYFITKSPKPISINTINPLRVEST